MRPAQLRRFAQPLNPDAPRSKAGFNEAGAAAPVCLNSIAFGMALADELQ